MGIQELGWLRCQCWRVPRARRLKLRLALWAIGIDYVACDGNQKFNRQHGSEEAQFKPV